MSYKSEYVAKSKPFYSVDDIRRVAEHLGTHFFEPATMRFFRSRIASYDVFAGRYFITSEQFVGSDHVAAPRRYTIREITDEGQVQTAKGFEFQQFATLREAKRAASDPHIEPTYENQLWHARKLLAEKGADALNNPHAMIGRTCGCGKCFCCAAEQVLKESVCGFCGGTGGIDSGALGPQGEQITIPCGCTKR